MTRNEFVEILRTGYEPKILAELLNTTSTTISRLRHSPSVTHIAEALNLTLEEVENVLNYDNLEAVYDFAVENGIDVDNLEIEKALKQEKFNVKNLKTNDILPTGDKIVTVNKCGGMIVYVVMSEIGNIFTLSEKQVKELYK